MFGINLGFLEVHLRANTRQFEDAMYTTELQLGKLASKMQYIGRTMTTYMSAPLVAGAVASVKAFGDFDQAMTESTAIMGDVSDSMRYDMEQLAETISRRTITSAKDLAQSYYFLASAGMDAAQSMESLNVVNNFAIAGMFDMTKATSYLADATSALGLRSKDVIQNQINMARVSDVLTKANIMANGSTEQFAQALTNKAAAALRILNKDVEEGVAVLAAFADQGKKGQNAGEAFAIVSRDLTRAGVRAADVWHRYGMEVYDSFGKMHSYADIIEQLENLFEGLSDAQKKLIAHQLGFRDESFTFIQMLIGTSERIREYEAELRNAGNTTEEVANKQMNSFNSQMKMLWNNIVHVARSIGDFLAPSILQINNYIRSMIAYWDGLSDTTKSSISKILGTFVTILVVLGPVLLGLGVFLNTISLSFLGIRTVFGLVSTFMSLLGGVIPFFGTIIILLGILSAVLIRTFNFDRVKEMWGGLKSTVGDFAKKALGFFTNLAENVEFIFGWIKVNWKTILDDMLHNTIQIISNIGYNISMIYKWMSDNADGVRKDIAQLGSLAFANGLADFIVFVRMMTDILEQVIIWVVDLLGFLFEKMLQEDFRNSFIQACLDALPFWGRFCVEMAKMFREAMSNLGFTNFRTDFTDLVKKEEEERNKVRMGTQPQNPFKNLEKVIYENSNDFVGLFNGFKSSIETRPELKPILEGTQWNATSFPGLNLQINPMEQQNGDKTYKESNNQNESQESTFNPNLEIISNLQQLVDLSQKQINELRNQFSSFFSRVQASNFKDYQDKFLNVGQSKTVIAGEHEMNWRLNGMFGSNRVAMETSLEQKVYNVQAQIRMLEERQLVALEEIATLLGKPKNYNTGAMVAI